MSSWLSLFTSLTGKEMIGRRFAIHSFSFSIKELVFLSQEKEWEETRKEMGEREIEKEGRKCTFLCVIGQNLSLCLAFLSLYFLFCGTSAIFQSPFTVLCFITRAVWASLGQCVHSVHGHFIFWQYPFSKDKSIY